MVNRGPRMPSAAREKGSAGAVGHMSISTKPLQQKCFVCQSGEFSGEWGSREDWRRWVWEYQLLCQNEGL